MKGQGISINVIIIAAIALLVLVILSVLLLRSGTRVVTGTTCSAQGDGMCKSSTADCPDGYFEQSDLNEDCGDGKVCCRTFG